MTNIKTIAFIICAASIILAAIFGGLFFFLQYSITMQEVPVYAPTNTPVPTTIFETYEPLPLEPAPTPVPTLAPVITYTVVPNLSNVWVNERNMQFNTYNINGAIYFRLDDLAYALKGTDKQFSISKNELAIMLTIGQPSAYAGLDRQIENIEKIATQEVLTLLFESMEMYESKEISLVSYQIEGHYYFRIREIADIIGFRVAWIGTISTIIIDTTIDYQPSEPIFKREPLPEHIIELIAGRTFRHDAPFDYCYLTYLTITHVDFHGVSRIGHMIVADAIGDEVLEIFQEIYAARFPIYRMRLIDFYGANDYLSMAENNSHAFNFRYIAGTRIISRHGLGRAIDINPIQNPYIRGNTVWPYAGRAYLDRSYARPGMVIRGDVVYRAFTSRGWIWGGNWTLPRDYHHFERRG